MSISNARTEDSSRGIKQLKRCLRGFVNKANFRILAYAPARAVA